MTSPSDGAAFAQRAAQASRAIGGGRPSTALSLAGSDLSDSEINLVGGFVRGMNTTLVARMARAGGAQTKFTPEERSQLDALGEEWRDNDAAGDEPDPRNWLERAFDEIGEGMANLGETLVEGAEPVFDVFDGLLDVVKVPARVLSSALDGENDDEVDEAKARGGYDGSFADHIAFMWSQGDALFHDLDGIRETYGDDVVDLAVEFFTDPEAYNKRLLTDADFAAKAQELMKRPEWEKAADLIDRQHISPGRDVARVLLAGNVDNAAFTALSGALDAVYTLALDPTLVVGKGVRLARAMDAATGALNVTGLSRYGVSANLAAPAIDTLTRGRLRSRVDNIRDQDGIHALFRTDADGNATTSVGKGVQRFLTEAAELRDLHAKGDLDRAAQLHAGMSKRFAGLMPLLDEVNGRRVVDFAPKELVAQAPVTPGPFPDRALKDVNGAQWEARSGEPITNLTAFANYLADTTGLLRLGNGFAAQNALIMPGRLTPKALVAAKIAERRFDHSKLGRDTIPIKEEAELLDDLDAIPAEELSDTAKRGEIIRNLLAKGTPDGTRKDLITRARARHDRRVRRLATLMPTVSALDLTSSAHAEQVRRFGRLYLDRREADRLAALWAMGNAADRRDIARGMLDQTFHASGLAASEQGQAFWRKYQADQAKLDQQMYGYDGNDVISTERGDVHVALHLSQLSNAVLLPSFREMQYLASKYNAASWMSRNVGARFYSDTMDAAMTAIKMGWITSPAGGLRNALDELAGVVARGDAGDLLKARHAHTVATAEQRKKIRKDSREWQDLVRDNGEEKAREILAKRLHDAATPEGRKAAMLEARIKHRIPLAVRGMADTVNDVVVGVLVGKYLSARGRLPDADEKAALTELVDLQTRGLTHATIRDTFYADDLAGMTDNDGAIAMAQQGILSTRYRWKANGYEKVEVDGGAGIDAWAGTLAMKFSDPADPAHVALRALWDEDAETAVAKVREYLDTDRMKRFVDDAEITNHTKDGRRVSTPEEKSLALDEYAQRLVADVKLAVTGRGPTEFPVELKERTREWISARSKRREKNPDYVFSGEVTDEHVRKYLKAERGLVLRAGEYGPGQIDSGLAFTLLNGGIPDRAFLASLPDEVKPRYAIKQQFAPIMPSGVVERMAGNWTEFLAKGYKKVVTDQVQAIVRNPLFASKYVTARRNSKPYEDHLIESGWSPEAAKNVVSRIAQGHAEQEVLKHIDNPTVSSQFSILARNFWAFERAQEDWLRRWGRILRDDPTVVRKAQLAVHAGTASGILHQDEEGDLTFTYPGSGVMIQALTKLLPGEAINIPVVPDLSSKLTFVNPSLDNPLGFSATPVISIPFKWIASAFGAEYPILMSSMDKVVNGELGAAREWYEQMLPTPVMRIVNGAIRTDPGSRFGQAYMQAIANLEAAGKLDELTTRDVNGVQVVDEAKLAELHGMLQAQIKNNMIGAALFGLWAPAAPGLPQNNVAGAEEQFDADWSFHKAGLESLKAEARVVFAELPYEEAMEWWTKHHPGELIYAQSSAGSTTKTTDGNDGASVPATLAAAGWMEDNAGFLKDYPGIGTYFLPQGQAGTPGGEFSEVAYRAQIEQGLREKKGLREYLNGVIVARGEKLYYDTKDDYDEAIERAERSGDVKLVRSLEAAWSQEKALLYGTNPLLAKKNAGYAENATVRKQQMQDLVRLMNDPKSYAAIGDQAVGVQELMSAFADYQRATEAIRGERGSRATRTRVQLRASYQSRVARITEAYPGLADLARGVFRIPA